MSNTVSKNQKEIHPDYWVHRDILFATFCLLGISCYMYGIRPLLLVSAALLTAVISDFLAAKLRNIPYDPTENSSLCTAMILTLMMPVTVSYYVVVMAVAVAVLIGKHLFGGYGAYPFNPAAVGYTVAQVGWTEQMSRYPMPFTPIPIGDTAGVHFSTSPMETMKLDGLPNITPMNLALGNYGGGMGATAVLVIASLFVFLLVRKRISLAAPVVFLTTCAAIAFLFPRAQGAARLDVVKYELLSSTLIYAAVFLLADLSTLPKKRSSRIVFGFVLGILTMAYRYYGAYEMGVCFAVIVVNALSGFLDRMTAKAMGRWDTYRLKKDNPDLQLKPPKPAAAEEAAEEVLTEKVSAVKNAEQQNREKRQGAAVESVSEKKQEPVHKKQDASQEKHVISKNKKEMVVELAVDVPAEKAEKLQAAKSASAEKKQAAPQKKKAASAKTAPVQAASKKDSKGGGKV